MQRDQHRSWWVQDARNSLGLNVDSPLGAVEVEGIEGTVLAQNLELVDNLVSCSVKPKVSSERVDLER